MILLGILLMIAALAWLWRWLVRHEADVRHRWAGLAAHPRVTALRTRFVPQIAFLQARLSPAEFLGLDLTIGAIILIGASWIFGGIAEDVVTGDPLTVVDREIAVWLHLHATPTLTEAMKFISLLGSWPVVTGICLFMTLYFVRKRSRYRLLALILTIPVGMLFNMMNQNRDGYVIGFPRAGLWKTRFNSNTVHLMILIDLSMSTGGRGVAWRGRSGKLLILRLTPRGLRRLRLETTRSCRISSSTLS